MRKMTRLILISAVLATSGLTAKIATENYKAMVTKDERIHTAHENLKKPNKAAVLEAIVDAADEESDKRLQKAVVLDSEEPSKTPRIVRVTTSAGVSPISSVMDKKTINKVEEFIEKIAHPAEVVMEEKPDFTTENIPIQELTYEIKDIFPEFEEITLTYKITLPEASTNGSLYLFDVTGNVLSDGSRLNCIELYPYTGFIWAIEIEETPYSKQRYRSARTKTANWPTIFNDGKIPGAYNIIKFYPETKTIDYSGLAPFRDSDEFIRDFWDRPVESITNKEVYEFLAGVEKGEYRLLKEKDGYLE